MSSELMLLQGAGGELYAGMEIVPVGLGAIPESMVQVVSGVQQLTPEGSAQVARLLQNLVLTPLLGACPLDTSCARAVTCAVAQAQNVGCFPNALQYIRAAQQSDPTPPLITVVDFRGASAEEVIVLTTRDPSTAMSLSPPGSQNAIFDYNVAVAEPGPPPGTIATTTRRRNMGGPLIVGAVGGALLGLALGGPGGAVAGGVGGALVGGVVGARA